MTTRGYAILTARLLAATLLLGACAVYDPYYPAYPGYPAYGTYVPPPVVVGPPVLGFGIDGGHYYHHGGWHRGHRY